MKKTLLTACLTLATTLSAANAHIGTLNAEKNHNCELFEIFKKKKKKEEIKVVVDPNKTEEKFKRITNRVAALYSGTIRERDVEFEIIQDWKSDVVNAYAQKLPGKWRLTFLGGLYREAPVTDDALALTACHEMGHLIGGAPYINGSEGQLTIEGQSDFWGSAVCLKRYFQEFPETVYLEEGLPKYSCDIQYYGDEKAQNNCYRSYLAGKAMAAMLAGPQGEKPELDSPDYKRLSYTDQRHPKAQCRLDTYIAGSMCDLGETNFDFDDKTAKSKLTTDFLCNERTATSDVKVEKRPKCWFNEKLNNIYADFDPKVISQKYKTLKGKPVFINYFNHLPGEYTIRITPMDQFTKDAVNILDGEVKVKLGASENSKQMFIYSFKKKTNGKIKLLVEVVFEGKVISAPDDFMEIDAKSFLAF